MPEKDKFKMPEKSDQKQQQPFQQPRKDDQKWKEGGSKQDKLHKDKF